MLLSTFALHRPETVEEAIALRREHGDEATLYAGGTELVLAMRMGVLDYAHLIDVKRIAVLGGITIADGVLEIGATATHRAIARSPLVGEHVPALARLAGTLANVRVRAAGTLAGNLAFGEPHADPPALLTALGARIRLHGADGERSLSVDEFLLGGYDTALADDELVTAIAVPLPAAGTRVRTVRFKVLERPTVCVAVRASVDGGAFAGAPTVVVGAVDDVPRRVDAAALDGARLDDRDAIATVAHAAQAAVDPVDDLAGSVEYKRHLTEAHVRRALTAVAAEEAR